MTQELSSMVAVEALSLCVWPSPGVRLVQVKCGLEWQRACVWNVLTPGETPETEHASCSRAPESRQLSPASPGLVPVPCDGMIELDISRERLGWNLSVGLELSHTAPGGTSTSGFLPKPRLRWGLLVRLSSVLPEAHITIDNGTSKSQVKLWSRGRDGDEQKIALNVQVSLWFQMWLWQSVLLQLVGVCDAPHPPWWRDVFGQNNNINTIQYTHWRLCEMWRLGLFKPYHTCGVVKPETCWIQWLILFF